MTSIEGLLHFILYWFVQDSVSYTVDWLPTHYTEEGSLEVLISLYYPRTGITGLYYFIWLPFIFLSHIFNLFSDNNNYENKSILMENPDDYL